MKDLELAEEKKKLNFRFLRFLFFELRRKNSEAGNSLNAVDREPVPTRVLNPNASEASYKPTQRSYRKTWGGEFSGGEYT